MTKDEINDTIRDTLTAHRADLLFGHAIHEAIADVVTAWEGKQLSKRFTDKVDTAIRPLFGEGSAALHWTHPGYLSVWDNKRIPYESRWQFFITGYSLPVSKRVTREEFEMNDNRHGASALREIALIDQYLHYRACALTNLTEKILEHRTAEERLRAITEDAPYIVRHLADQLAKS